MSITIDDSNLHKVMAQAMLSWLTPEKRDELLVQAVARYFSTKDERGYDKRAEIERIFDQVMAEVGRDVAAKLIRENPDVMAKLRARASEALEQVLGAPKLKDFLSEGFARALSTQWANLR